MADPVKNPNKDYVKRVPTNIRLEAEIKEALENYCSLNGVGLADVVNNVVQVYLRAEGYMI